MLRTVKQDIIKYVIVLLVDVGMGKGKNKGRLRPSPKPSLKHKISLFYSLLMHYEKDKKVVFSY